MAKLFIFIWLFRAAVTLAVYLIIGFEVDRETSSQICHIFRAPDALVYHHQAIELAAHFGSSKSYLTSLASMPWETLLAILYWIFTPHLVIAAVFCHACLAMAGSLAFSASRTVGQPKTRAIFIALVIGLWPPSFAYTIAPLRDGPVVLGIFLFLVGIINLNTLDGRFTLKAACWSLAVMIGFLMVTALRQYLWPPILVLGAIFVLWPAAVDFIKHRSLTAVSGVLLIGILLVAGMLSEGYWRGKMMPTGTGKANETALEKNSTPQDPYKTTVVPKKPNLPPSPSQPLPAGALLQPFRDAFYSLMLWREGFIMTGGDSLSSSAKELRRHLGFSDHSQVVRRKQWKTAILRAQGGETGRPQYAVLGQYQYIFWHKPSDLVDMLPAALWHLWLYPLPWQTPSRSITRPVSLLIAAQGLVWLGLLPGVLFGLMNFRAGAIHRINLNLWVCCLGVLLALVVVNLGTLYRLRDMALLPAIIFISAAPYLQFGGYLRRILRQGNRCQLSRDFGLTKMPSKE